MDQLATLIACKEIQDSIARYARGVDRRDWEAVRDCYFPDAHDWHGDYKGDPAGFIAWVSARHADLPASIHFLGNCLIEFTAADVAQVETYFIATQRRPDPAGGPATDAEVHGRYIDRFECRQGAWKVAERIVVYDNSRFVQSNDHLRKGTGLNGRRDGQDAVYQQGKATRIGA